MVTCQYAQTHIITDYECPEVTHSMENKDFCPRFALTLNFQAKYFKILRVGFYFVLWEHGQGL